MPLRDDPWREYYAELVELARKQGRDPDPRRIARAEGRRVEPGEIEAWERRLDIDSFAIDPQHSINVPRRPWSPSARSAGPRPRWYLRSAEETSARSRRRPGNSSPEA